MDTTELPIDYLAALRIAETGLSAAELASLPMDEFLRVTGRPTMGEIAAQALGYAPEPHGTPRQEHAPVQPTPEPEPKGIDPNGEEYFHAWRANRTRGGEGQGIFHSVSSQSDQYSAAARRHAGRTAMGGSSNVVEPPRLTGRYLNHDAQRDTRTAAQRFGTPGNSFQI